jgi:DNA-binding phage protein
MSEPGNSPYRTFRVPSVSRFEKFSYLGTREERAAYIDAIKEENDPELCLLASRDVKIAKHISAISKLMRVPYAELVKRIVPRYTLEQLMELCEAVDMSDDSLTVPLQEEHGAVEMDGYGNGTDDDSDSQSDKL